MLARVHRVSPDWVDQLVVALRPAFIDVGPPPPLRLEAWSTSKAITGIAALAKQCDVDIAIPTIIDDDTVPTGDTVIVVADYLVHPRWADQLSRAGVTHCPVIFSDQTITVGPLVTPGHTPCLVCLESHRRDNTVGWLEISSQLWGKLSPLHTPYAIGMAWSLLILLLSSGGLTDNDPGFTQASFFVDEGRVSWRATDFHPSCTCRGLHAAI